jgi:hypothetical protein
MNGKMNRKEKYMSFAYVFLLFAVITTACCLLLFYYNSDFLTFRQKNFAVLKMDKLREYQDMQSKKSVIADSLLSKLSRYNPMVNAIYEENDIEFMINELKNVYEQHAWDVRYKSFLHVSAFYSMWFTDKKDLWHKRDNIMRLRKNLEECEIGLGNKKNELMLSSKK